MPTTEQPRSARLRPTKLPINPATPVTSIFIIHQIELTGKNYPGYLQCKVNTFSRKSATYLLSIPIFL